MFFMSRWRYIVFVRATPFPSARPSSLVEPCFAATSSANHEIMIGDPEVALRPRFAFLFIKTKLKFNLSHELTQCVLGL
jgi:hypothetical protein